MFTPHLDPPRKFDVVRNFRTRLARPGSRSASATFRVRKPVSRADAAFDPWEIYRTPAMRQCSSRM
jgi:hypothetical protein